MTYRTSTSLVLLLTLAASPVFADREPVPAFDEVDADGDGYITREEASGLERVAAVFDRADVNRDGMLDEFEFAPVQRGAFTRG